MASPKFNPPLNEFGNFLLSRSAPVPCAPAPHPEYSLGIGACQFMTAKTPHILCIDDYPDTCLVVRLLLEKNGFQVSTAATSAMALDLVQSQEFDLIITDLRLNDCDGLEHLKNLKRLSPETPVVVISGESSAVVIESSIAAGAADYLVKPVGGDTLLRAVAERIPN